MDSVSRSPSSSPPPPPFSMSNPRPDLPPATAQSALRKLVALELQAAGFDAADADALDDLEGIVWSFFGSLLTHAHELAALGRRTAPTIKDVVSSCEELGVGGVRALTDELERDKSYVAPDSTITYDKIRKAEVRGLTLDSDSEDDDPTDAAAVARAASSSATAAALRASFLPPLPARHSYRQTPVFPKSSIAPPVRAPSSIVLQTPSSVALAHISTLRSRLSDSQLVATSLRNLIRKTSAREQPETVVEEGAGLDDDGAGAARMPRVPLDGEKDVVSFEEGWYAGEGTQRGTKRTVTVVRVGANKDETQAVASAPGGAAKRRKWRV